jgi:lipid II:glycine glycyltransferase (peptidoglycan interpeptide bridge formation enzyme)
MVSYFIKYGIFPVSVNWFGVQQKKIDKFIPSVYYHIKGNHADFSGRKELGHTLEISLNQSVEELKAGMVKSYRQQIRQSEEAGILFKEIPDRNLFVPFYNSFAEGKGIPVLSNTRIQEYGSDFIVVGAYLDDVLLAAHTYLIDRASKTVRVFHSATQRLNGSIDRNLVGKANKYLHYCGMLHFKNLGFEIYDFGGIAFNTENPDLQGINNFKTQFGGNVVESFTIYSYLYYFIRGCFRRFNRR